MESGLIWLKNMLSDTEELNLDEMLSMNATDSYKNKKMEYITDEMRQYTPKYTDVFLPLKNSRKARLMISEPLELEEHEIKLWNDFLQWI